MKNVSKSNTITSPSEIVVTWLNWKLKYWEISPSIVRRSSNALLKERRTRTDRWHGSNIKWVGNFFLIIFCSDEMNDWTRTSWNKELRGNVHLRWENDWELRAPIDSADRWIQYKQLRWRVACVCVWLSARFGSAWIQKKRLTFSYQKLVFELCDKRSVGCLEQNSH